PLSANVLAVPPVDTSCTPRAARALAKSTRPVLSETLSMALIRGVFLDSLRLGQLLSLRRWRASVESRGRVLAVFFYVQAHCKEGKVRCLSQVRSSGSTTPRVTDSLNGTAAATSSCTSPRSRATASGRWKRARPSNSRSSMDPRVRRPETLPTPPSIRLETGGPRLPGFV